MESKCHTVFSQEKSHKLYKIYTCIIHIICIHTHTHTHTYTSFSSNLDKDFRKNNNKKEKETGKHKLNEMGALNRK